MVGVAPVVAQEHDFREIKVGVLVKRSQNKSIVTQPNYQTRLFVLDTGALRYFAGTEKNRGDEKGSIDLSAVLAVEPVEDGLLPDHKNVFQVVYTYSLDESAIALYVVTPSVHVRDSWVTAIRTEAQKSGAGLLDYYHRGILVEGVYNCCGRAMGMEGCQKASPHIQVPENRTPSVLSMGSACSAHALRLSTLLVDTMLKRAQGRSVFFSAVNYKRRTFVLDANSLRYYDGDLRELKKMSEDDIRRNERCRIHLSCVVAVEPAELERSENYRHVFQVVYFDEYELLRLYVVANSQESQQKWIKAIKREAVKHGAEFFPSYHPGLYLKNRGKWDCCEDINRFSEGCRRVVALPDMKLCGAADLNASNTASVRAKSPIPVKVAAMLKRSQNKSTFFSSNNYQERVFTLDNFALAFYSGYLEDQGKLKGSIPFVEMLVVETVKDGMLDDKINVFQVVYHEDNNVWNLYVVATSEQERISWINAIKKECARSNVSLLHRYHLGVWVKAERCYNCCRRKTRDAQGCAEVTGMSLVSVRDRTNTMDSMAGYRQRLGTLDSVPEHAIAPSPARPDGSAQHAQSQHYSHQLQLPDQGGGAGGGKRPRFLRRADGIPIQQTHPEQQPPLQPQEHQQENHHQQQQQQLQHKVRQVQKEPAQDSAKPPLPNKDNKPTKDLSDQKIDSKPTVRQLKDSAALPKPEASQSNEKSLSGGQWTRNITDLTLHSAGVFPADQSRATSSSTLTREVSGTRKPPTANSSLVNSRQASSVGLNSSTQYSEDFESISELEI